MLPSSTRLLPSSSSTGFPESTSLFPVPSSTNDASTVAAVTFTPVYLYLFFALLAITVAISGAAIAFYHHDGSQAEPEEWSNIRGFIPHLFDSYLSRARVTTDWKDIMPFAVSNISNVGDTRSGEKSRYSPPTFTTNVCKHLQHSPSPPVFHSGNDRRLELGVIIAMPAPSGQQPPFELGCLEIEVKAEQSNRSG